MDIKVYWSSKPNKWLDPDSGEVVVRSNSLPSYVDAWAETLVATCSVTIDKLQAFAFAKAGRAKRLEMHVYTPPEVSTIIRESSSFGPPGDARQTDRASSPIGRVLDFTVHEDTILSIDAVRVVAVFDIGVSFPLTMFGTIKILDMPERREPPPKKTRKKKSDAVDVAAEDQPV